MTVTGAETALLEIKGVSKSFGPTRAVIEVSLKIGEGEVRGLIGENGSGKSTLSSMVAGSLKPDAGSFLLRGEGFAPNSMLDARKHGVSILVQEIGTINDLTVAENIFLGREHEFARFGIVNKIAMNKAAQQALNDIGVDFIRPESSINDVSFEDRKLIEVATALKDDPDLLILDETTTALSQAGRSRIYSIVEQMKERGKTVIFISHDLQELEDVCDNVTVLRDGELVDTIAQGEVTIDRMRRLMIGRDLTGHYYRPDQECSYEDDVVLNVEGVSLQGSLEDVSLRLHRGEILGIGGLTDCGMHELGKLIFGILKPDAGLITREPDGKRFRSANGAAAQKMGFLPKNREEEGLMPSASVKDNIVLMSLNSLETWALIVPGAERKLAQKQAEILNIKTASLEAPVSSLSGGNKQKVVIAKWLANDADILVMDCPTRGIDVGVKASIYELMMQLKNAGKSIIMISEEMPELLGMSDTILLLKHGRTSATFTRRPELSESELIEHII